MLDLFCGAGGASVGYERAGFEVVGVDLKKMRQYPLTLIQGDCLELSVDFLREFDVIHASPPCQKFSAYNRRKGAGEFAVNLIPETRDLLRESGKPYVIENVPGAPLIDPVQLCGSSFGLDVRRHRLFESNVPLVGKPCDHSWQTPRFPPAQNRTNLRSTVEIGVWRIPVDVQRRAMGIDWMGIQNLSQAIPPAYTEFLGRQLFELAIV